MKPFWQYFNTAVSNMLLSVHNWITSCYGHQTECIVFVNYSVLTPRLRATLLRISQGLEEQRLKQSTSMGTQTLISNMSAAAGLTSSTGLQSDMPPSSVFGGSAIVMAPTNLYALKVESCFNRHQCAVFISVD